MPHSLSAKKRHRQNITLRGRNRSVKRSVKTEIRKVRDAIEARDVATCETQFRAAAKHLDQAAAHKIIHRNAAARIKSRLSAQIKAVKQGPPATA
jgi:small subunit ribosomal protein S20